MGSAGGWAGLFSLVTMEVVLGVDNLVFISILADRAPPETRDKARVSGLMLALMLRIALLFAMSGLIRLTRPLLGAFSGRDIIFMIGGLFLLYKATSELHERLEAGPVKVTGTRAYAGFWSVVIQITLLDAVFSLDSVITAVGMVQHLSIMILAVFIAIGVMLLASRPLAAFVSSHPTVVVLCLSFLLMIGFSLVADGLGMHVPKEYLYAAIGFSVLIEIFNQIAASKQLKIQSMRPLRARTAELILRLMGEQSRLLINDGSGRGAAVTPPEAASIAGEKSSMISGVLSLSERSLRSLMTPRNEIRWINLENKTEKIIKYIQAEPHSLYPLCQGRLDELVGVARGAEILNVLHAGGDLAALAGLRTPTVAPESVDAIRLIKLMRQAGGSMVMVVDEFGSVSGLITPVDIFEIIAGEFHDEDEKPQISPQDDGSLLVRGQTDLHFLEQSLNMEGLMPQEGDYGSVAGLLLDKFEHLPEPGETLDYLGLRFVVEKVSTRRIEEVRITRLQEQDGAPGQSAGAPEGGESATAGSPPGSI
ncbi:MAG: TerC family protein [Deltaproteobacteria bacterium]|nr:TerC family protein [Deltaproteobacteria bacterium]